MRNGFSLVHAVREPQAQSNEPAPVLVLLHGVGSNEQDLMSLAPYLDDRFFVVSARAPLTMQHGSYGWYRVQSGPQGFSYDADEAQASLAQLLSFLDEITASYNVDPDRLYLLGFSQGCIMSVAVALTQPRRLAGVVGLSGRLLPEFKARAVPEELRGLPLLISHGVHDSVITIEYGRAIRDFLATLPVELTYHEYPIGHSVGPETLADAERWLSRQLDRGDDWRTTRT